MIRIQLQSAGKKFQKQWVFRRLDLQLSGAEKLAITGENGSGKSTLLQIISGFQTLSEGSIQFYAGEHLIDPENWYTHLSYAAPYLDVPEEYNLAELISFYASLKPFQNDLKKDQIMEIMQLSTSDQKAIKHFSSGMKQRLKLSLAILSKAPVLLLDEPLSNLDKNGHRWYQELIQTFALHKTILVCSNQIEEEISFCTSSINIHDFKV